MKNVSKGRSVLQSPASFDTRTTAARCCTLHEHPMFRSGSAKGSADRRNASKALDKNDLMVRVSKKAQEEIGALIERAARVRDNGCKDPKSRTARWKPKRMGFT